MIEKKRLEKLIEQKATIYHPFGKKGKIKKLDLENLWKMDNIGLYFKSCCDAKTMCYKWKDIYENKAEAEWVAKMHAERVEKFEPPTFEKFDGCWNFYSKKYGILKIELNHSQFLENTYVNILIPDSDDSLIEVFTKENYIKAVEFARKLFLGLEE